MITPRYRTTLLRAGRFLLDGGGMFGVVPRVVWERTVAPDDRHRIELAHNCLYLESVDPDPSLGRPRRVIIETGTGDKLEAKMAEIFGLEGITIHSALEAINVDPASIDDVVITHLHFDHAGGLTRRCQAGEAPDWTAPTPRDSSGDAAEVKLTFPSARIHVQQREWIDALANDAVMTRTYYRDHLEPIRERVVLHDSPRPFPVYSGGGKPHRSEFPKTPIEHRLTEVLPGIRVFLAPGHTWGQQAVLFDDADGSPTVFVPDVMPTAHHIGQAYALSYDVEPYTSMVTKGWLLADAARLGWTLCLDHDPGEPFFRVEPTSKGWFALVAADRPT